MEVLAQSTSATRENHLYSQRLRAVLFRQWIESRFGWVAVISGLVYIPEHKVFSVRRGIIMQSRFT